MCKWASKALSARPIGEVAAKHGLPSGVRHACCATQVSWAQHQKQRVFFKYPARDCAIVKPNTSNFARNDNLASKECRIILLSSIPSCGAAFLAPACVVQDELFLAHRLAADNLLDMWVCLKFSFSVSCHMFVYTWSTICGSHCNPGSRFQLHRGICLLAPAHQEKNTWWGAAPCCRILLR